MKSTNTTLPGTLASLFALGLLLIPALPTWSQTARKIRQPGEPLEVEYQFSSPSAAAPMRLDCREPAWEASLPFGPESAAVNEGRLWISILEGNHLRVAHVGLAEDGLLPEQAPEDGEAAPPPAWKFSRSAELPSEGAPLGPVLAAQDHWLIGAGENVFLLPLDPEAILRPPAPVSIPLTRVHAALVLDGTLFVAGEMEGGQMRVCSTPLSAASAAAGGARIRVVWQSSLPLPQRREGLSLFAQGGYLYVAGGEGLSNNQPVRPREMIRAQIGEGGMLSSWQLAVQLLPDGIGRSRGISMEGVHMLTGDSPVTFEGEELTSQTMVRTSALEGGVLSMWQEFTLCLPALEGEVLVAGEPDSGLFLIAGGRLPGSPVVEKAVRAYFTRPSQLSIVENRERENQARRGPVGIPTVELTTGLRKASREKMFHLVILVDPEADNDALRRLLVNRNTKQMMRGLVVSSPAPDEMGDAQALIGSTALPALALLNPEGRRLSLQEGVPDLAGLFQVLSPAWAPVNPEQ